MHNLQDVIDSRDVIARIEHLEAELDDLTPEDLEDFAEEARELEELLKLSEEGAANFEDWEHGVTLIHSNYFTDYCKEFAIDCGDFDPSKVTWPMNHIDWDAAAEELLHDYFEVDFAGQTYWGRV